ncbi:MAG: glycoside hydrolase family 2 TIM barrel-domain containing protein, partial [Planctomycetota bacterium]
MQTQDSSEGWPDGIEVIDAYFEAIGGRDAIRKLENRVTKGSLRLWEDASGGSFEIYQEPPGNSYMKVQFGERRAREVWTSGDVAWAKRGRRGIRVLGGSQKAVALRGASLDPLLDWEDHFEKAETAGVESVGDAICHKVVLTPAQGRPMTCWFDRDSRLLVQTKQLDEASFSTQTRQYSDYRDVDGVLVPHTLEDTQWGLVQRVESVEHDAELPEGIFDVPDEVVRALAELEEAEREGEEAPGTAAIRGREKLLMDFGWRFHYGDFEVHQDTSKAKAHTESPGAAVDFDDSEWRAVNLPHDFVVEGLHTETAAWVKGSLVAGAGWYRRSFRLPRSDEGRRLYLEFEGVYRNCQVYLNGFLAGTNLSGYASFRCDITDFANYGGRNILAVRVDASADEGWWYEGGGVYRHVWLVKTDGLHVAPWGVFVWSDVAEEQPEAAQVNVQTKLLNRRSEAQELTLRSTVWGSDGLEVAQVETALALGEWAEETVEQAVSVPQPALWSVEEPNLYLLTSVILVDGEAVDSVETTFGIRTVRFDPDTGLYLNGKPVKIKGVCCHQDHAGVGVALPDRLHEFRIETLKEMGCNAYRTAHHPHAPAIMDACDRLGMLVLDETRVMSSSPEFRGQLERLVLRDRNHPSVIMWSIGNEEGMVQGTPEGTRLARTMRQVVRKHDPTRP